MKFAVLYPLNSLTSDSVCLNPLTFWYRSYGLGGISQLTFIVIKLLEALFLLLFFFIV